MRSEIGFNGAERLVSGCVYSRLTSLELTTFYPREAPLKRVQMRQPEMHHRSKRKA